VYRVRLEGAKSQSTARPVNAGQRRVGRTPAVAARAHRPGS
jgi:hypothetical protein